QCRGHGHGRRPGSRRALRDGADVSRARSRPAGAPHLRDHHFRTRLSVLPELPDIEAYLHALRPRLLGRPLLQVRRANPFILRTAIPPISNAEGREIVELRRLAKRIAIGLTGDLWLVLHLMIAGRLHWRAPGAGLHGRNALLALDLAEGSLILTEAGSKR